MPGIKNTDEVLYNQGLSFILKILKIELISRYHDDLLASHFGINKKLKLITWKYH